MGHIPMGVTFNFTEQVGSPWPDELMARYKAKSVEFKVEVKDGKVRLEGSVPERTMKHRIEDIAEECSGVKDVDNRIRVSRDQDEHGGSWSGSGAGASGATGSGASGSTGSGGSLHTSKSK